MKETGTKSGKDQYKKDATVVMIDDDGVPPTMAATNAVNVPG
jgi:hypothetical protein